MASRLIEPDDTLRDCDVWLLLAADIARPSAAPVIPVYEPESGPHRELTEHDIKAEELRDHYQAKWEQDR